LQVTPKPFSFLISRNLIDAAVSHFGALDILICNAGLGQSFFLEAANGDTSNFKSYMDINYWGCVWPTFYALPHLVKPILTFFLHFKRKTKGHIVVVSSLGGLVPFPRQTLYNSSKYALQGIFSIFKI
jgi:NAD(P)-dependent dehydrogenase (short-subunit alcohol dehydrogenase family)